MSKAPILVVADRLKTRKMTIASLREAGYEVRAIPTSEEAVAHTQAPGLPYFLALVDLNIRNGEAMRVLRQLREQSPRTVTVAITRHADPAVIQAAYEAGAIAFVHSLAELTDLKVFLQKMEQEAANRRTSVNVGAALAS